MSRIRPVVSRSASRGTGGYTPALVAGDYVFVSGQGPLDPETLSVRGTSVAEQTRFTLENVLALVQAAGGEREDIVRCNCYLASIELFDEFAAAYAQFFSQEPRPTRTTIGCELTGILVEIDCIAYVPRNEDRDARERG
jgi:2-iminobutanoate/2-iminopropanoate deaminase